MAELDELLTAALRDLATEAPALPPLPPRARRRIRARRATAIVASVAVVAGVSAGAVLGVRALTKAAPPPASPRHPVTAYVLSGSGRVIPIRAAANQALPPVKLGRNRVLCAIAVTPDGKTAYVASHGPGFAGTVTPIRTATNTALPPIKSGGNPFEIAITPDGKTAYVSLVSAGVIPIRTTTNTALPELKIGYSGPIAITP